MFALFCYRLANENAPSSQPKWVHMHMYCNTNQFEIIIVDNRNPDPCPPKRYIKRKLQNGQFKWYDEACNSRRQLACEDLPVPNINFVRNQNPNINIP